MRRRRTKTRAREVDSEEAAREKCLRLLASRARSAAELKQRLARDGFGQAVIAKVVSDLGQAGLVNDEEFARSWVAARARKGVGRRKLRWELLRKGIAEEIIGRLLESEIDDETELRHALELAARRYEKMPDASKLARLRHLLLARGFDFDTVDVVMKRLEVDEDLG